MKAPPFSYVRAATLAEAFQLWRDAGPEARLLAGGQSLLASLAFRLSEPGALIDISRVRELRGISQSGTAIRVGALTTHAELGRHELLRQHVPLLAEAVPLIAHPAIRNRGTLGGSLAFADPAAELPACCVALDAMIVARNAADERRIPAAQFFTGLYATALKPNELIAAVEFPVAKAGERAAILELARRSGDYAMAGVAARASAGGEHADRSALRILRRRRRPGVGGRRHGRHQRPAGAARHNCRRPGRARRRPRSTGRSARRPRDEAAPRPRAAGAAR